MSKKRRKGVETPTGKKESATEMTRPASLSADEAKEKIRLILAQGKVELSYHCKRDSMPRRSVTLPDIVNTLQTGEIRRAPEWDDERDNWKYRVEGVDTDDDDLAAITIIIEADFTLFIVTVF